MTEIFEPEDVHLSGAIVVDAGSKGNEARFINSVTLDTGGQIQKNATMMTVWCRGNVCPDKEGRDVLTFFLDSSCGVCYQRYS